MDDSSDNKTAPDVDRRSAIREDALAVVKRLRDAGHVAYFAGGCVRDMLLGLDAKDYDVATDAAPDRVRKLFTNTHSVGAAFGVILVRQRRSQIEVATFRSDVNYVDGRRPEKVVFTTAEEDAKRRDFTINGLFYDPVEDKVIDYVGGQEDLKNRILRAIGEPDHRFEEDHLRLLRALRFTARFGLTIDPVTSDAIHQHVPQLTRISPERVAEELRVMLTPPSRAQAWRMIRTYGIDDIIFRFVRLAFLPPHPGVAAHGPTLVFDRVSPGSAIPFGLALAAAAIEFLVQRLPHLSEWRQILERLTVRNLIAAVRQALKISNEECDDMEGTLYGLSTLLEYKDERVATLKRFLARPTALLSRQLLAAMPVDMVGADQRASLERRLHDLEQTEFAPPPLITGDDLTAAGLTPGPVFKRVLDAVYDAQLEDRVKTKQGAIEVALRLARES